MQTNTKHGGDYQTKKSGYKIKKIKENHIVLMLTLVKKCLEDGYDALAEKSLTVS